MSKIELVGERTRSDRMFNIAATILNAVFEEGVDHGVNRNLTVTTDGLRARIRKELGLCVLAGEAYLGDLRAHGDALGGHGLKLKVERRGSKRVVVISDVKVLAVCREFVEKAGQETFLF